METMDLWLYQTQVGLINTYSNMQPTKDPQGQASLT